MTIFTILPCWSEVPVKDCVFHESRDHPEI